MQFTDITFALFLFVVFCLYWLPLRGRTVWQNVLLLAASYTFYGWWDWRFLGLIILTTVTTWLSGLYALSRHGKLITGANIVLNLGILVAFKYFNFFSENLGRLFSLFGLGLDWFTIDVLLPVGISFYTFQAIAYSVDVYKGRVTPCRDPLAFFTFIAYFPQLVAGPIERASQLLKSIIEPRRWDYDRAVTGMRMILFGLLKKVCVADMLALIVERIFNVPDISPVMVLVGGVAFSIEIYCDFSAYSEIARGVSRLLGIELMVNFRFPYFSRNILEFWRRWHISLMWWFRDYLYIPLGGSRRGTAVTIRNTLLIFLLSGLWHGAAWNFIVWGAYWGIVYVAAKFLLHQRNPEKRIGFDDIPLMVATIGVVALGFYFFRCDSWSQTLSGLTACWVYVVSFGLLWLAAKILVNYRRLLWGLVAMAAVALVALFILRFSPMILLRWWWLLPGTIVLFTEWKSRNADYPLQHLHIPLWRRMAFYWVCIAFIILSEPTEMTFIYFQF